MTNDNRFRQPKDYQAMDIQLIKQNKDLIAIIEECSVLVEMLASG